jgi:hypothetical protein
MRTSSAVPGCGGYQVLRGDAIMVSSWTGAILAGVRATFLKRLGTFSPVPGNFGGHFSRAGTLKYSVF